MKLEMKYAALCVLSLSERPEFKDAKIEPFSGVGMKNIPRGGRVSDHKTLEGCRHKRPNLNLLQNPPRRRSATLTKNLLLYEF